MNYRNILHSIGVFILITTVGCSKEGAMPPINETLDLDGRIINDSSLLYPKLYLLSAAIENPTPADLKKPVIILAHGFSATTFEWQEFKEYSQITKDFYTSQVLLGAHGRDYVDFKNGTWEQWQSPIVEEFNKLSALGYENINIAASSTGCPLVLDMLQKNKIDLAKLRKVYFVDPVVVPSNKTLSLIPAIGPALDYVETTMEKGENGYWYKYRPYQALEQLNEVTQLVRKELEEGIVLPKNIQLVVYKSLKDGTADPVSAALLKRGIHSIDGGNIDVVMVNSQLHVFTRLRGRNEFSNDDVKNQQFVFNQIKIGVL